MLIGSGSWSLTALRNVVLVASVALSCWLVITSRRKRKRCVVDGFVGLIGNTPMVRLRSLSRETGCTILAKAEFMNPGGTAKDRAALSIIEEAEASGRLRPGGTIYEGSSGSTGISLALIAAAKGYRCRIFMPSDQAMEKTEILRRIGADVERVAPVSIVDCEHYVNAARRAAAADANGFFADQFENVANMHAHYTMTGPEIWEQTDGRIDAFVCSAGTGGTIAGVSRYLKERCASVITCLADPQGSALYNYVTRGVCYAPQQAEGKRTRHQVDTIVEGVGLDRVTANIAEASIDEAYQVTDREAVEMSRYLAVNEGLFLGSSSAVNCVAAVRLARALGPGHVIVTLLCDSGQRHLTKFWNAEWLQRAGLDPRADHRSLSFVT